ncbi:MAG TPA: hypothetical protein VH394_20660 [Thermoanaerobaculia bacterium]|jgi:hypothetical protein|nr:hypothetical protein [Thermoanaerobaculia bacterium]
MSLRRASLTAALGTALFALLAFGTVHAVWIVPIWRRLLGGLPFTIAGALALAWAYAELLERGVLPRRVLIAGLVFGLGAWVALVPATGLSLLFRLTGVHWTSPNLTTAAEVLIAAATGLAIGLGLRAGWRCAASMAVAAGILLSVQAGPVAVLNGRRPLGLFFLLAGIYALSGILQAVLTDRLRLYGRPGVKLTPPAPSAS